MKKRISLFVIASCALLSITLNSTTTGAWWNEPGPNHKSDPSWPHKWHWHHYQTVALAEETPPTDTTEIPVPTPSWWNETGPNH
jgi:hypothetical protein